jgi:hypothetical protein
MIGFCKFTELTFFKYFLAGTSRNILSRIRFLLMASDHIFIYMVSLNCPQHVTDSKLETINNYEMSLYIEL